MRKYLIAVCLGLLLLLAACDGDEKQSTETPANPSQLVADAAQKLKETSSFQLLLEASGTPVTLAVDQMGLEDTTLTFQRAEGTFVAPDRMEARVTVALNEVSTEVQLIAIGEEQFINHAFITQGKWQAEYFSADFRPAALILEDQGIASAISSVENLQYIGREDLDGIPVHHLQGMIDAHKVQSVTVGLIGTSEGKIKADLYIRTEDGLLEKLILEEPLKEGQTEPTRWTIGLYGYNQSYTIEAPEVE